MDRKKGMAMLAKKIKDGGLYSLEEQKPLEVFSTGIATLDSALGCGGFVRGSQVIIYGAKSAGKSALCYTAIAELQKQDPEAMACIVDIERSARKEWLERFGVDTLRVTIVQEPTIEESVNTFQDVMRAGVYDLILVDSLGAAARNVELNGKDGNGGDETVQQVGGSSRVISDWVKKANGELITLDKLDYSGTEVIKPVVVYINQVRDKIGARVPVQTMPGGNTLEHMASVIIKVRASGAATDKMMGTVNGKSMQVGTRVICDIEKNKLGVPHRQGGYNFCYEECPEHTFGIDNIDALFSLAVENGVIKTAGAWCSYHDEGDADYVKAQGKANMMDYLYDNEGFYQAVYDETMEAIRASTAAGME